MVGADPNNVVHLPASRIFPVPGPTPRTCLTRTQQHASTTTKPRIQDPHHDLLHHHRLIRIKSNRQRRARARRVCDALGSYPSDPSDVGPVSHWTIHMLQLCLHKPVCTAPLLATHNSLARFSKPVRSFCDVPQLPDRVIQIASACHWLSVHK